MKWLLLIWIVEPGFPVVNSALHFPTEEICEQKRTILHREYKKLKENNPEMRLMELKTKCTRR